jgi:hypothetical protein
MPTHTQVQCIITTHWDQNIEKNKVVENSKPDFTNCGKEEPRWLSQCGEQVTVACVSICNLGKSFVPGPERLNRFCSTYSPLLKKQRHLFPEVKRMFMHLITNFLMVQRLRWVELHLHLPYAFMMLHRKNITLVWKWQNVWSIDSENYWKEFII